MKFNDVQLTTDDEIFSFDGTVEFDRYGDIMFLRLDAVEKYDPISDSWISMEDEKDYWESDLIDSYEFLRELERLV